MERQILDSPYGKGGHAVRASHLLIYIICLQLLMPLGLTPTSVADECTPHYATTPEAQLEQSIASELPEREVPVIVVGNTTSEPTPPEVSSLLERLKSKQIGGKVLKFFTGQGTLAQAKERLTCTIIRFGISGGASTAAIVVNYHSNIYEALGASLGLALFSAGIQLRAENFARFLRQDSLVRKSGLASADELEHGNYTNPKAQRLAKIERAVRYFITSGLFIAIGELGRIATGVTPSDHLAEHLSQTAMPITMGAVEELISQGAWDLQGINSHQNLLYNEQEKLLASLSDQERSQIEALIHETNNGDLMAQAELENLKPEYSIRAQQVTSGLQRWLLVGSAVSVASTVSMLSPHPWLGHAGLAALGVASYFSRFLPKYRRN